MKDKLDYRLHMNIQGVMYDKNISESASMGNMFSKPPREEIIGGSPVYTFPTILTTVGTTSRNGIVLMKDELDNMQRKELVTDRMAHGGLWCELDHPEEEPQKRFRQVMMKNQSHRINEFFYTPDGAHLAGEISTGGEGVGRILANMIAMKSDIAFSMRAYAVASKRPDGSLFKDINLVSYDAVFMPSNRASWASTGGVRLAESAYFQSEQFREMSKSDKKLMFGVTEKQIAHFMESSYNKHQAAIGRTNKMINLAESVLNGSQLENIKPLSVVNDVCRDIAESIDISGFNPTHILLTESHGESKMLLIEANMNAEVALSRAAKEDVLRALRNRFR